MLIRYTSILRWERRKGRLFLQQQVVAEKTGDREWYDVPVVDEEPEVKGENSADEDRLR